MPGPDIQAQKEVAQALVDRRAESSFVNQAQREAAKKAGELRVGVAGSDQDLDAALQRQANDRPFEAAKGARFIDTAIGKSEPSAASGRTAEEIQRANTLKASIDVLAEYTSSGNIDSINKSGLDGRSKEIAQHQAMDAVLSVAKAVPQIESIFIDKNGNPIPETNVDARREIIKGLMNDPEFLLIVKQVANEKLDPEQARAKLDALQAKQTEAKRKHDEAKVTTARAKEDREKIDTQLDTVTKALGKYEPGMVKDTTSAAYALKQVETAINTLTGGTQTLESIIAGEEAVVRAQESERLRLDALLRGGGTVSPDVLKTVTDAVAAANSKIGQAKELQRRHQELLDEKARLEAKQAELQAQQLTAVRAEQDAKRKESEAFADVNLLQGERTAAEMDLVRNGSTSEVLGEAASRYFRENYDKIREERDQRMAEEKSKLQSEAEQKAYDALARIWHKPEDRGAVGKFLKGDRGHIIDADKVNTDFATLLAQPPDGGPDKLQDLLVDSTGAKIPLTPEQWGNIKGRVVQELIQRKLAAGGMKSGEAELIFNSTWGKDVIGKAQAENARFNSEVLGKLQADGLIQSADAEGIKAAVAKHPKLATLLLALIFGAIALPAGLAVGAVATGAGVAKGGAGAAALGGLI